MMKYNNNWLINRFEEGENQDFLFFWKPQPSTDGNITESCLSQWWQSTFTVEGTSYPTAEHWMMASKAKLFGDFQILENILQTPSPADVKKLGRKVMNFKPELWEIHKYNIVVEGNIQKFTQHPGLKEFLLSTQERVLVEASPMDTVWGIGLSAENPKANHPSTWQGQNLLGYALMDVRDKLK